MSEENIDNNSSKDLGMDLGDSVYETYYTEDKIRSAGVSAGKELGKMVSESSTLVSIKFTSLPSIIS